VIPSAALRATPSPLIESLAHPKMRLGFNSLPNPRSSSPPRTNLSRTVALATPRKEIESPVGRRTVYDWDYWDSRPVPQALEAEATERVVELSSPKKLVKDYVAPQPEYYWEFKQTMKEFNPSDRLNKLAAPPSRRVGWVAPTIEDWYEVRRPALAAVATDRLTELSAPVPRKVSQRKK
jgi:hypothetical protein